MFNNRIHSLKKFFLSGTWTLLPSIVGAICLISSCSNVSITHNMEGSSNNNDFNTKKYSRVIEKDKRNNHKIHDACPECNFPINTKSVDAICCGRCDKWYHFIDKCCGLEIENLSKRLIREKLRDLKLAIKKDKYAYLCSICKRNGHCVLQETNLPITDETSDDNNEEGTRV